MFSALLSSPLVGVCAVAFLFAFSVAVVLAAKSVTRVIDELRTIRQGSEPARPKQPARKPERAVKPTESITIKPQNIKKIYFKDDNV